MTKPLRCHLLIGPPASGKTTLAHKLSPLLRGPKGEPGLVLSTDVIRAELFGDAAVQGPWPQIRERLQERLLEAVAADIPVIIDATHARRPWRLSYTQALGLPRPVEWIGWWLQTPVETCKEWALSRERLVPEAVITEFAAALGHKQFGPDRSEGFAAVVPLNPATETIDIKTLSTHLDCLDARIRNAVNLDMGRKYPFLHRYSRLLDLERLLYLIRLLTTFNGLDCSDPATASALGQVLSPAPEGDLAQRAAAYLVSWKEIHGGNNEAYGDAEAIRNDLDWLTANGFNSFHYDENRQPIEAGSAGLIETNSINGGYPSLGDSRIFRRVMTLLRHILQEPFDSPSPTGKGAKGHQQGESSLYGYLIKALEDIDGSYSSDQKSSLRKDLEELLTPYGLRPKTEPGRPGSLRHGYAIGTALLSADQLLEIHEMLKSSLERLSDQSQKPVLNQLRERLIWAKLLPKDGETGWRRYSKRALANRSFTDEHPDTLSSSDQSQRIEKAILDRRLVRLRNLADPKPTAEQKARGDDGSFNAWPLQLLFHNISWYLAFETYKPGHRVGLISTLRVDRLKLVNEAGNTRRNSELQHQDAMERLQNLLYICGGIYFGHSIDAQLDLVDFETVRFSCTGPIFRLIREEPHRFPTEQTRYSQQLPGLAPWEASNLDTLTPNPPEDSHPYPVEIRLPRWTVESDWDLKAWLFRFGAGIRIEQPTALRELHRQTASDVISMYG